MLVVLGWVAIPAEDIYEVTDMSSKDPNKLDFKCKVSCRADNVPGKKEYIIPMSTTAAVTQINLILQQLRQMDHPIPLMGGWGSPIPPSPVTCEESDPDHPDYDAFKYDGRTGEALEMEKDDFYRNRR